jgi:hypothetical protein
VSVIPSPSYSPGTGVYANPSPLKLGSIQCRATASSAARPGMSSP